MRGTTQRQVLTLSTLTPEQMVLIDHPVRRLKVIVERAPRELSPTFDAMYARVGARASHRNGWSKGANPPLGARAGYYVVNAA